jgi:hypothetical protein
MVTVIVAAMAGSCAIATNAPGENQDVIDLLDVSYRAVGGPGNIDQVLSLGNDSDKHALPHLEITALDKDGKPIESVRVSTLFGSDRGMVLVPAGGTAYDVLKFTGGGSNQVEDVEVTVSSVDVQEASTIEHPEVDYLGKGGRPVDRPWRAVAFRVSNPGDHDYAVRLVGIVWATSLRGRPQQADQVIALGGPIRVPAHSSIEIPTTAQARNRIGSAKAYITAE